MNNIKYHYDLEQGTDEWLQIRCGLLTASEMKLIITPSLKIAKNDKQKMHLYELMAQRITNYTEPTYINDAMLRGNEDEILARDKYTREITEVKECGFITNDKWGFKLGYSPDGLVDENGLIEAKSRVQKHQFKTICEGKVPKEFILQIQTGLLVSERKWCDFISYCGGAPWKVIRMYADDEIQSAIIEVSTEFHNTLEDKIKIYKEMNLTPTERVIQEEYGEIV